MSFFWGGGSEKNRFFENVGDFLVVNHSGTLYCINYASLSVVTVNAFSNCSP